MTSTALTREIERYVAKTPKSRALQAEAEKVLPGGSSRGTAYFATYPFYAIRLAGGTLFFGGMLIMAYNVLRTAAAGSPVEAPIPFAAAPAA